jgi:N-acetylmuramoyl-L-alanine amidase
VTLPDNHRAQVLRQAVESNLDVILDRLPQPVLSVTRGTRHARRSAAATAAMAMGVILAVSAAWPPTEPAASSRSTPTSSSVAPRSALAAPTPGVATAGRSFSPGVLGLGVRTVAIDAGHGGTNHGTSSSDGVSEKFVTLDIARRLRLEMQARGFQTVMTREGDETVSLQQRAAIANAGDADVFVSVHLNSFRSPTMVGIETYYLGPSDDDELDAIAERENQHSGYSMADLRTLLDKIFTDARRDESRRLAAAVQHTLVAHMRRGGETTVDRGVKSAPFVVLVATDMPAILAEVSCLSNAHEAERLNTQDYRQQIAAALAAGVDNFARVRGTT